MGRVGGGARTGGGKGYESSRQKAVGERNSRGSYGGALSQEQIVAASQGLSQGYSQNYTQGLSQVPTLNCCEVRALQTATWLSHRNSGRQLFSWFKSLDLFYSCTGRAFASGTADS